MDISVPSDLSLLNSRIMESKIQNQVSPRDETTTVASAHLKVLATVFVLLIVLTGTSYWIANSDLMSNRQLAWGLMIAVSLAKASLVASFFMHLWWERAWKYVLTIPALVMGCLLTVLLIPDIAMRAETYSKQRREAAPKIKSLPKTRYMEEDSITD